MINSHIINFIKKYQLQDKTIIVGFSGGFDSSCLIYALNRIKNEFNLKIIGAHYNHNWRGEIAKQEQENCKRFCENLEIEFYTETAPENIKKNETEARELRYKFFEHVQEKFNTNIVFTAHNFNDNAETLVYRIAKGTGLVGLKGILEKRDNYYRPLLEISREDIENYCKENNLNPNNDNSNNDTIHKRNLIRHDILPLFKEINTNTVSAINNLSKVAQCELDILDEYIKTIKKDIQKDGKILTKKFKNLSKNLQQKIIYDYIYNSDADYDYKLIENAVIFLNNSIENKKIAKFSLTKDLFLYVDSKTIEIIKTEIKNNNIVEINELKEYEFNDNVFKIEECLEGVNIDSNEDCVNVDLSEQDKLYLRTRRDGDIIQPLGSTGTMKLKKYLMSKKIPQHKRDKLLLLCNKDEVLWVCGVGLNDKIKTKTISTHKLQIRSK